MKDTGTTVTRPRSQFNSEQSIELDNVSPPCVSFPAVMGQKDNGKNLCKQGWGIYHKTIPVFSVSSTWLWAEAGGAVDCSDEAKDSGIGVVGFRE